MKDKGRRTKVYRQVLRRILFKKLNEYSQKIYDELEKKYPPFIRSISSHPDTSFGGKYIQIEFKSLFDNNIGHLFFLTATNNLTVGADHWHCHFDNIADMDYKSELVIAMDTIKKIQTEEIVLVYCYNSTNKISVSYIIPINEIKTLQADSNAQYSKIEILSWKGTYNKLISVI